MSMAESTDKSASPSGVSGVARRIVRDETREVRTVVSVEAVDGNPFGTYGWFIGVRGPGGRDVTRDRARYGRCVICRRPFADDDQVHMVGSVQHNSKTVGNRLCCGGCAGEFATFHRRVGDQS